MSDWKEIKRPFREALIAAFNWDGLKRVLIYHCDLRLDRITSEKVGFENNVDVVIDGAVRDGWLEKLAEGALAENQSHTRLKATVPHIRDGVAAKGKAYYQGSSSAPVHNDDSGQASLFYEVPGQNDNFTGREEQLRQVEQTLGSTRKLKKLVIAGLGGLGKTQLALEFCYRRRDDYQLVGWVKADEAATLGASLADLAKKLGLVATEIGDQEAVRRQLLDRLESMQASWLLVFDNVDTMEFSELNPYLPRSGNGHVIITSRNPVFRSIATVMELGVFESGEAAIFLQKRSGKDGEEEAQKLAEVLGFLPLALEHAAAYVEASDGTFAGYQDAFIRQRQELWKDEYHGTVKTTWELSLKQLHKHKQKAAVQLLELCSFLAPDDIPLTLLRSAADEVALPDELKLALQNQYPLRLDKAITGLRRYSLLTREDDLVTLHRLVQLAVRDWLGEERSKEWAARAVRLLLANFPEDDVSWHTWQDGKEILPHAVAVVELAEYYRVEPEQVASLNNKTGVYLQKYGDYAGARPFLKEALAIREKELGADHPDTATSLSNFGLLLYYGGPHEEAPDYLERALIIREQQSTPNLREIATNLDYLGRSLRLLGKDEAALTCFERALAINEEQPGEDPLDMAKSLGSLGALLRDMGRYKEAREHLQRALDIHRNIHEEQMHPDTAVILNSLGRLLRLIGECKQALTYHKEALAIRIKVLGSEHPETARNHFYLGVLLQDMAVQDMAVQDMAVQDMAVQDMAEFEKAELELQRALDIRTRILGPGHTDTAMSLNSLGNLMRVMDEDEAALKYYEQALAINEEKFGKDHRRTNEVQDNLDSLLAGQSASMSACQ